MRDAKRKLKMRGHTEGIKAVKISPDGRLIISESVSRNFCVWDISTGECLVNLYYSTEIIPQDEHKLKKEDFSITSDGQTVISPEHDNYTRLWETISGKRVPQKHSYKKKFTDIVLSPDGRTAITILNKNKLIIWNILTGVQLQTLTGHRSDINLMNITLDGRTALSASDKTIRMWDIFSGKCLARLHSNDSITALSKPGSNGHVVFGTVNGQVHSLHLRNIKQDLPIVTPVRLFRFDADLSNQPKPSPLWFPVYPDDKAIPGHFDDFISAFCLSCGQRFIAEPNILDTIKSINKNANLLPFHSPCLELPEEAWQEPKLNSKCPNCNYPLRYNPFIVDNRELF
jgi:WD40 repeat protein